MVCSRNPPRLEPVHRFWHLLCSVPRTRLTYMLLSQRQLCSFLIFICFFRSSLCALPNAELHAITTPLQPLYPPSYTLLPLSPPFFSSSSSFMIPLPNLSSQPPLPLLHPHRVLQSIERILQNIVRIQLIHPSQYPIHLLLRLHRVGED